MLKYVTRAEYTKLGYTNKQLDTFTCGVDSFDYFLHESTSAWENNLSGITYLLINDEEDIRNAA